MTINCLAACRCAPSEGLIRQLADEGLKVPLQSAIGSQQSTVTTED